MVTFQKRFSSFEPILTEGLVIRSKSLSYMKIAHKKKKKKLQKMFGVHSLEPFAANTRSFHVKKHSSETLVTLSEEAQFI